MTTVRNFSPCGPCIEQGELIRETAKFYVFRDRFQDRHYSFGEPATTRKLAKSTPGHYSRAHTKPCPSCRDHARTQYPNGYMD